MALTGALGTSHSFGLFLQPMSADLGWGRQTFSFAIAIQNLVYGLAQPVTGMIADKYGAGRVMAAGAVLYAIGLTLMALSTSGIEFGLSAGIVGGLTVSCSGLSLDYGVIGQVFPVGQRGVGGWLEGAAG